LILRGKRSKAREAALKLLYQLDITQGEVAPALAGFFKSHRMNSGAQSFATELVSGTREKLTEIDALLAKHATNWSLDRMAVVDRNVLRLSVYELFFSAETPPKVVINEAVELAKRFGSLDSSKFVNGVLDSIHKLEKKPQPEKSPVGEG